MPGAGSQPVATPTKNQEKARTDTAKWGYTLHRKRHQFYAAVDRANEQAKMHQQPISSRTRTAAAPHGMEVTTAKGPMLDQFVQDVKGGAQAIGQGVQSVGSFAKSLFTLHERGGPAPSKRPSPNATPTPEIRTAERVSTARKRMRRARRNLNR